MIFGTGVPSRQVGTLRRGCLALGVVASKDLDALRTGEGIERLEAAETFDGLLLGENLRFLSVHWSF